MKKMKERKSGDGTDNVYTSSWFAFKSLYFLADKNKPRHTYDAGLQVSTQEKYIHNVYILGVQYYITMYILVYIFILTLLTKQSTSLTAVTTNWYQHNAFHNNVQHTCSLVNDTK